MEKVEKNMPFCSQNHKLRKKIVFHFFFLEEFGNFPIDFCSFRLFLVGSVRFGKKVVLPNYRTLPNQWFGRTTEPNRKFGRTLLCTKCSCSIETIAATASLKLPWDAIVHGMHFFLLTIATEMASCVKMG